MTMSFFKKVMTFFSAIWNAILWRKIDKKAKQATKSVEEVDLAENSSNPIPVSRSIQLSRIQLARNKSHQETDKLFAEVPLHSHEPDELFEQELLISDEIPAPFAPVVAHNVELQTGADSGIKKYSSGVQLFGFEDETSPSLRFFSEPVRHDTEPESPFLSPEEGSDERDRNENVISETALTEPENDASENQLADVFGQSESEELSSPPSDPIPEEAVRAQCTSRNALSSASIETPNVTSMNNEPPTETLLFTENMELSLRDHLTTFPTRKINPDLHDLAIGNEEHLFDHDGIIDISLPDIKDSEKNEKSRVDETSQPGRNESTSMPEAFPILGTTESVHNDVEGNQPIATSSIEVVLIGVSVSTQTIPDTNEHTTESISKYSTNYMVKSDSLVNFFPEGGNDPDVKDVAGLTDVLMETAKKSMTDEAEEKEIPVDHNTSILKEGGLEEMMCTSKGVLKLSGDHHLDCNDGNNCVAEDPKHSHDIKTAVDDFLMDDFPFEEPLLITHHLEGNILEEACLQCDITDHTPIFREFSETVETGLDGSESVEDSDVITNNEFDIECDAIGRCRSVLQDGPISPNMFNTGRIVSRIGSPKPSHDDNEESKRSPCKLSQFTTFHLDDEPNHLGHLKKNELLTPGMPTVKFGEMPASVGLSDFVPSEIETNSSNHALEEGSTCKRFLTDSQISSEFLDGPHWRVAIPLSELEEVTEHVSNCHSFPNKQASSMLANEKSCKDISVDGRSHSEDSENTNDFYPFVDGSSYLFRIPEEIRKEPTFNPCVGAAPSRRSGYTNNANRESPRYDDEHDVYGNKFSNMSSVMPNCVGTVPLINTCVPEEYKNARLDKLPDGYNHRQVSQDIGTFWEAHSGLSHPGEQQQGVLGYPVSCTENYYDGEDLNVMPTAAYENNQTNVCTNPEGYGFMNPYGAVEFPMLSIPLCGPHSQSAFIPRGTLAPLVFPIGPMSAPENENLPSLMNLQATVQNQQFSIPHPWGGYTANVHLQNDDEEERGIVSVIEVGDMTPIENLSCTGTNDDDDDLDTNQIIDPYLQLTENNSLHTVRSKADSYSGSLFCESLRSLISHNTENENIFPSFSCSSVQGCCPSIAVQSCETTVSNDSLPSIIVEETNYSKSVDEDYLATEKFMNDVNTALNESVLDQIHGQVDLHSNLLGRGDGSMPMGPGPSGNEDHIDTPLGENISINNSKLTLLDGALGSEGGGPRPEHNLSCELDGEISNSAFFRDVLDSLVEDVITTSASDLRIGISERNTDCREYLDESGKQENPDRDLVVQNMMFIEGAGELRQGWTEGFRNKQEIPENKGTILPLDVVVGDVNVSEVNVGKALKNAGNTTVDNTQAADADDIQNRRSRRNRRRRKKLSDVDSEFELDPGPEVTRTEIGDGAKMNPTAPNNDKAVEGLPSCSELDKIQSKVDTSNPGPDGELFTTENTNESPVSEQDLAQNEDECDGHQEEDEEPGENSGNPPNTRRRRNRRRKRKN